MKFKKLALCLMAFFLCFTIASCKKNKDVEYKISFELNGGSWPSGVTAPSTFSNKTGLATLPQPERSNFTFKGWFNSNDDAKDYANKTEVKSIPADYGKDVKLYAAWADANVQVKHSIKFNLAGGTFGDTEVVKEFVEGIGLSTLPTPTKDDGSVFAGWFDASGKQYTSVPADCKTDLELTARWNDAGDSYELEFDLAGGSWPSGYTAPNTYSKSLGLKLNTLATPTKTADDGSQLVFSGWMIEGQSVTEIEIGHEGKVTLTASWATTLYYNITYVCEGGTLPDDAPRQYKYGEGCVLPEPTPNDPTQKFLGWYTEDGTRVERITSTMTGDITLTANFGKGAEYHPLWELNQIEWSGQGMNFAIKVNPVIDYDPNNPDYTGSNRSLKQLHQSQVEAAYDISIVWSQWDDAAPWGPERVKFINRKYLQNDFGDVYVLSIASQWIPTLVKGASIAELYDLTTESGIFSNLPWLDEDQEEVVGYEQKATVNEATSVKQKVYGYATEEAHPDYFMYYNVDLVKKYGLQDPAEMWMKGEWTLTNFETWARNAQNQLSASGGFVFDMGYAEAVIGMVAASGNKMTSVNPPLINLTRSSVTDTIEKLQTFYNDGLYYARGVQDVSPGFQAGTTILHHGDIWFMKASDRFNPSKMTFTIGVVPYPAADGQGGVPVTSTDEEDGILLDNGEYLKATNGEYITTVDMSNSSFKVPYTGTSCYAVLNVNSATAKNGITTEIITHIFHDLYAAIGPDPNSKVNLTPEESYRAFLKTKFDRDIDIEVIMSCQQSTYFELMEILSMTVGDGSHFGANSWWPLCGNIVKSKDSPATKLQEVLDVYKQAMRDLGYNIR